jgi:hypothetical protein
MRTKGIRFVLSRRLCLCREDDIPVATNVVTVLRDLASILRRQLLVIHLSPIQRTGPSSLRL